MTIQQTEADPNAITQAEEFTPLTFVCVAGAKRHGDLLQQTSLQEKAQGYQVVTIEFDLTSDRIPHLTSADLTHIERVYRTEIELAQRLVVLNVDDVITAAIGEQIRYARQLGVTIAWYEPHTCHKGCPCGEVDDGASQPFSYVELLDLTERERLLWDADLKSLILAGLRAAVRPDFALSPSLAITEQIRHRAEPWHLRARWIGEYIARHDLGVDSVALPLAMTEEVAA